MERKKRKNIFFDLDSKKMNEIGVSTNGYNKLRKSLNKYGFSHGQGSGYVSERAMNYDEIVDTVERITSENPWIAQCVKKFDISDYIPYHDFTPIIENAISKNADSSPVLKSYSTKNVSAKQELHPKDEEVISRIRGSKMGAEFNKLYDGKYVGEKSVADKKLVSILSFFTNGDNTQIQRIFETSKLYEPTKGSGFISEALSAEARSRAALTKSNTVIKSKSNYSSR